MKRPSAAKVYVAVFYKTAVVTRAGSREEAARKLRAALSGWERREAKGPGLLRQVAPVYWSSARGSYWYRFGGGEACSIHPSRVDTSLRESIPEREPPPVGWLIDSTPGKPLE